MAMHARPTTQEVRGWRGNLCGRMTTLPLKEFRTMTPLRLRRGPGTTLLGLLLGLGALAGSCAAAPQTRVELQNSRWRVAVDPASLALMAAPAGKRAIHLSAPQDGLGAVAGLEQTGSHARLELHERKA